MSDATFTFRVDDNLKSQFTRAAKSKDRSGAQLLRDFMRDFVQQQQEAAEIDTLFRNEVEKELTAAAEGKLISGCFSTTHRRPPR